MAVRRKNEREINIKQVKRGAEVRNDAAFSELQQKYGKPQTTLFPFPNPYQQPITNNQPEEPVSTNNQRGANPGNRPGQNQGTLRGRNNQSPYQTPAPGAVPNAAPTPGVPGPMPQNGTMPGNLQQNDSMPTSVSYPTPQNTQQNTQAGYGNSTPITRQRNLLSDVKEEVKEYGKPIVNNVADMLRIEAHQMIRMAEDGMMGNMPKTREYKMIKPMSSIGSAILVNSVMQAKNKQIIRNINGRTMASLKGVQDILYAEGISTSQTLKLRNERDFRKLVNQSDVFSIKMGRGKLSQMSKKDLLGLIKEMEKNPTEPKASELRQLAQFQLNAKKDEGGLADLKTNHRRIRKSVIRGVSRSLSESGFYSGYTTTMQTKAAAEAICRAVLYEGRVLYRGNRAVAGGASKGAQFVLKKIKLEKAADKVAAATNKVANVANTAETLYYRAASIPNEVKNQISVGMNTVGNLPANVKNSRIGRSISTKVGQSKPGRSLAHMSQKTKVVSSRIVNQNVGIKVGKRFFGTNLKNVGKKAGRVLAAPSKAAQLLTKVAMKAQLILKTVGLAALKAVGLLLLAVSGLCVVLGAFAGLIVAITSIGDAVSDKYEDFKTKTSMGAAYQKLLDKEAQFSAAISSVTQNVQIPQEFQDEYGISQYSDISVAFVDGNGGTPESTSTIKQILAMAAIYIDQDFGKYGAFLDGTLTDSIYKDYCAKLYDATHIIAVAPPSGDGSGIYYCSTNTVINDDDDTVSTADEYSSTRPRAKAMDNCNNVTEGILETAQPYPDEESYSSWNTTLSEYRRKYSAVVYQPYASDHGSYYSKDYYRIAQAGPHGNSSSVKDTSESYYEQVERIEEEFQNKGCEHFEWVCTSSTDDYSRYTLVCTCPMCKGHIDATTYVFVSNIYDPTDDVESNGTSDAADGGTSGESTSKKDAYDNVDKKDAEMKFSMYVLDKYATAFDSSYAMESGRPGDQASCDEADPKDRYAAEKYIMDRVTGKDTTIVEWWNNDDWLSDLNTTKTYYRILRDGDIEKATSIAGSEDDNVVNTSNSDAYWFRCFSAPSGRNTDFELHGWDESAIMQVRMLLAGDWEELYGITNFGGLNVMSGIGAGGTGLSESQIAQLIANNTSWSELCDDRKALMATCLNFYNEIQRLGVHYHGAGCSAPSLEALKQSTSPTQYFGIGGGRICPKAGFPCSTQRGIDCSGFVSWIVATTFPGQMAKRETTSSMGNMIGGTLLPVDGNSLLPGDIALKPGSHVLMYIGNGQWAEAAGHSQGVVYGSTHGSDYFRGYGFYRLSCIDETKHTIDITEEDTE